VGEWLQSDGASALVDYIQTMNEHIKGKALSVSTVISPVCVHHVVLSQLFLSSLQVVQKILIVFERLSAWIDEIPPETQSQRYGNKSFRTWFAKVKEVRRDSVAPSKVFFLFATQNTTAIMLEILPEHLHRTAVELAVYFLGAWGNETRIDYGTGHEMSFVAWMCCLELVGAVDEQDRVAMVFKVFNGYAIPKSKKKKKRKKNYVCC